jgi:hypothetical protein
MRLAILILTILLVSKSDAQYVYRGQVFSAITRRRINFGSVHLITVSGTGRYGKEVSKVDSLGYFTFSLKDTSNVQIIVDCGLNGRTRQRIFYSDSLIIISIKMDCFEYNVDRAKKDIADNKIHLLCDFGYEKYKFTPADSAFEKKYGITYQSFGDSPIWLDCMFLYNNTVAEYLDKKFGNSWRNDVRWDVPFFE